MLSIAVAEHIEIEYPFQCVFSISFEQKSELVSAEIGVEDIHIKAQNDMSVKSPIEVQRSTIKQK